ncbi:hypothetical protein BDQ94DRAFT_160155 [Aspergillus welwitschiae]|uniref:PKS/mFAS DH domain-containing protein n=1 Tax=Aspergillus welwitschiae TaxID=1341132 RepID=A0A3F3PYW9_9EURO|nr:hypothetical protein BDQ94DRAFT_160155 [Aspergillus welwitschiae]RDH32115.1 hypothetical protein BDQ94DRAFT_160155 [Aspergillus welwitschiae]
MDSGCTTRKPSSTARLLVWSSSDKEGIRRIQDTWIPFFANLQIKSQERSNYLDRLSHTLISRRSCLSWRAYAVTEPDTDWNTIPGRLVSPGQSITSSNLAYIFSGQGAQWYAMGRELLDAYPTFFNSIREANAYLRTLGCQWDLLDALQKSESGSSVNLTDRSQTLCTALQIALVDLLEEFGITPKKVVGHSSGEIAAAYSTHAISRREAWRIAFYRGVWSSKLETNSSVQGSMLAVALSQKEILTYLNRISQEHALLRLTVACINSPNSITVSGDESQIQDLKSRLEADQVFCRRLKVKVAYHSFQMHEIASHYESAIGEMDEESDVAHGHRSCMVSTVTGNWITPDVLRQPQYWARNLVSPVRFSEALGVACISTTSPPEKLDGSHYKSLEVHHVVEIGPHSVLQGPTKSILADLKRTSVHYISLLQRNVSATSTLLDAVGYLWAAGYAVDLAAANQESRYEHNKSPPCLDNLPGQISRNTRLPRFGKHELLGTPDPYWNPHQPRWRHIIRTSAIPWVQDHKVQGTVLYPGAGMILMGVEAGKQLCRDERQVLSLDVLDTDLLAAIQVPDHGDVEASFSMSPVSSLKAKNSDFFNFRLDSAVGSSWTTNCTGSIRIMYEPQGADPVTNEQVDIIETRYRDALRHAGQECDTNPDVNAIYDQLKQCGYSYGETFRGDYCSLLTGCGTKAMPTYVPTHIKRLRILCNGLPKSSESFKVLARGTFDFSTEMTGSIPAFGPHCQQPVVFVEGLKCTEVDGIEWKPYIRLLDNNEIEQYCPRNASPTGSKETMIDLNFVVLARVLEGLRMFTEQKGQPVKPHLQKYIQWAAHQKHLDRKYIHDTESRLLVEAPLSKLLINTGRNLLDFLTGAQDPLKFFFTGSIVDEFYEAAVRPIVFPCPLKHADFDRGQLAQTSFAKALPEYMNLKAHTNPSMEVIEIGAGTGVDTRACLRALGASEHNGGSRQQVAQEGSRMEFERLDIDNDPTQQGFEAGKYDMVVAAWVFVHATVSLERTLTNMRKLLKPGGKLVLAEVTGPFHTAAAFGLLEGWWLSCEPYRAHGPCVDRKCWHDLLQKTGFSGCDLYFPDFEDGTVHELAVLVSTAVEDVISSAWNPGIEIVYDPSEPKQQALASFLEDRCQSLTESSVGCLPLQSVSVDTQDVLRVFLLEFEKPLLYGMDSAVYEKLQSLLTSSVTTLWVTSSTDLPAPDPRIHLIEGLFRVLSQEDGKQHRYILFLEGSTGPASIAAMIQNILQPPLQGLDTEYVVRDGRFFNQRLFDCPPLEQAVSMQTAGEIEYWVRSSISEGFRFIETESIDCLGDLDVELEIHATGLNFRDVLTSLGQIPNAMAGQECAGVVTKLGSKCTRFKPGDRIAGIVPACFQARTIFREDMPVVHIPSRMSFAAAAGIPTNFITAWCSLAEVARIQPGESVLIHSGAGGTGQAPIQLAVHYGAEVYTTVGTEEKKSLIMKNFPIPGDHIFSSRSTDFASAIMHMTNGRGVDVVVNSLSGEGLVQSWECTAPYGRFVELGLKDILTNAKLPMAPFRKNVSYRFFDLSLLLQDRQSHARAALNAVMDLMYEGNLHPQEPTLLYGVGELEKAYRYMQSGKNLGKIVIELRHTDIVKTVIISRPNSSFEPNATYLVAGGLGGLGQSMIDWLVSRGARNILILFRSGGKDADSQEYLGQLRAGGVKTQVYACDITDERKLRDALADAACHMPPIRGCIQSAMVLQDVGFENMSLEDWQTAVRPKVQGSWNLHKLLPRGLDFFLMLSSMNGIAGHVGQANYAAGNTFQDALAHHRTQCGENAATLDLGLFTFTGRVARDPRLLNIALSLFPHKPITEPEFHALLDVYCNPAVCKEKGLPCQVSFGMRPQYEGASIKAYWVGRPVFRYMAQQRLVQGHSERQGQTIDLPSAFRRAESLADATAALQAEVATFDIIGRATNNSLAGVAASRSKLPRGWS